MTSLTLIRHGQASFGSTDYDRLSALGERQAALTGRHLAYIGAGFDAVLAGTMKRQRDSAAIAGAAWTPVPEIQTLPAFDEYDAASLFRAYLPAVLMADPELAARQRELFTEPALFQRLFEGVTARWLAGEAHAGEEFESWPAFVARVQGGLAALHDDFDRDAQLAVFTSGGPIAVAVAQALNLSAQDTIRLNWTVYNAGMTELRSTRSGWRLVGYNNIAHLRLENDPNLVTLR